MKTLTWDDYFTIAVLSAVTIILSAIFEWKRSGREKQLEDERFNCLKAEVESQKHKISELELSHKTLEISFDANFSELQKAIEQINK